MKPKKFRNKIIKLQTEYAHDSETYYDEERDLVIKFLRELGYKEEANLLSLKGGGYFD